MDITTAFSESITKYWHHYRLPVLFAVVALVTLVRFLKDHSQRLEKQSNEEFDSNLQDQAKITWPNKHAVSATYSAFGYKSNERLESRD
jgi:hypothetical protein